MDLGYAINVGGDDGVDSSIVPKLLYSCNDATKDAKAFHESCDGEGATLTIIRCTNGYVFGGYNPDSWITKLVVMFCLKLQNEWKQKVGMFL